MFLEKNAARSKAAIQFDTRPKDTNISGDNILDEANKMLHEASLQIPNTVEVEDEEITGETLLNQNVEQMKCLVSPIIPQVGCVTLAGGSDTGKSSILRQLAIACVTGESTFLGFTLNLKHKSVIFVATEDDRNATAYLLKRQCSGLASIRLKNLRFLFESYNLLEVLDNKLTLKSADLVIIDCFSDSYGNDLKDTQKIRTFLHQFQELAIKHQCLILFLHHTAKRTEAFEPSKNNLLSGQGFEAKMRLVMELRLDLMHPNTRHLCIVKGNYLPSNYKKESFVLEFNEETFLFTNTGERTPFELLVKQQEDPSKAKWEKAKQLKDLGYSYALIAEKLGYGSKGSITKLFDKAKENGWDTAGFQDVSNGND